jgi:peroxiredoxin
MDAMIKKAMKSHFPLAVAALLLCVLPACAALPEFHLRDTTGAVHTPAEWASRKAVVLYFTTIDCPVANSYVPEMNRIHDAYASRGVLFLAVQADTSVAEPEVARYAAEYRYAFPVVLDPRQVLVQLTGAATTPQAAVVANDGRLLYLGRVDNRVEDFGKQRPSATVFDLRDALDATLAGKPVAHPSTRSIGCAITRVTGQ